MKPSGRKSGTATFGKKQQKKRKKQQVMAAMADDWQVLKFQSWASAPDAAFWQALAALKLHKFRLDDGPKPIVGFYALGRSESVPARLVVDDSAFPGRTGASDADHARYDWKAPGTLINTNTLEAFKTLDKAALLQQVGAKVLDIVLGEDNPPEMDALNSFVLVTFADLKKHSFLYWFGFPALSPPAAFVYRAPPAPVASVLSTREQVLALRGLLRFRESSTNRQFPSFFVIERRRPTSKLSEADIQVLGVAAWRSPESSNASNDAVIDTLFGFVDPCSLRGHPGWPLRNFLALLSALPEGKLDRSRPLKIISFREHVHQLTDVPDDFEWRHSLVFPVKNEHAFMENGRSKSDVRVVGWEANVRGKMGPRIMELSGILDPIRLAETSVDLNLKLMRWRQLPALDLELIARTKCLLLGAGTLGCYTARSLLAWGFRNITFVDNSTVSHSNPVRQPLFEFQDCGKSKGECAANALKRIFPLVNATSVQLTIPMAGHALSSSQLIDEAKRGLETLQELIESHDVIFLGTDSRESRWLPTVIAAAKKKLVLNAALGFDSYLVMRHGVQPDADAVDTSAHCRLGCYFCNDIVSPRDSLKDRTLDQMCTVTRPGLAPIASSTAVELLVAVLHSPSGKFATAEKPADGSVPLGYIPHQLRGFLNAFQTMLITGEAFDKCIACSTKVIEAYEADPFGLLENACNSSAYLEELTGLNQLTEQADALEFDLEDSDEDGDLV